MVRNVRVHFDSRAINDEYDLSYNELGFEKKVETWGKREMEGVKNRIAVKGAMWERFENKEFKMKNRFLNSELGPWFNFIAHSLVPTSHTS